MKNDVPKTPVKEKGAFPMRINQYLALNKYSTRRGGDELVEKNKVFINGKVARLGDKVNATDVVEVKNHKPKTYVYFAYSKPKGVVTHSAQEGEDDIETRIAKDSGLSGIFPIGRLDKDSHGLIILTNDGRVTDRLLNPDHEHDKEYMVKTREKLRDSFKKNMEAGVDIEGYFTRPCVVKILGEHAFSITLTEGKKHQVRRMVVAMHNDVVDLNRTRVLSIDLGNLKPGQHRKIEGAELEGFLKKLGL
jgi:pseudouridine synthase